MISDRLPVRIQRKRTKGWAMPQNTVVVSRPTKWGNPFIVNPKVKAGSKSGAEYYAVPTLEDALACYREMIFLSVTLTAEVKAELGGKNLACWCSLDQPCHADVLLEIANEFPTGRCTDEATSGVSTARANDSV